MFRWVHLDFSLHLWLSCLFASFDILVAGSLFFPLRSSHFASFPFLLAIMVLTVIGVGVFLRAHTHKTSIVAVKPTCTQTHTHTVAAILSLSFNQANKCGQIHAYRACVHVILIRFAMNRQYSIKFVSAVVIVSVSVGYRCCRRHLRRRHTVIELLRIDLRRSSRQCSIKASLRIPTSYRTNAHIINDFYA